MTTPTAFSYSLSSSDSWQNIPSHAYHGTYDGTVSVEYDEEFVTSLGYPSGGSYGFPRGVVLSSVMTGCGMAFWNNLISTGASATPASGSQRYISSTSIYIALFDTRGDSSSGAWVACSGFLNRPTYERVKPGDSLASTIFYGVEVAIDKLKVL